MQATIPPVPPAVYTPGGLPNSLFDGLPVVVQGTTRFSILGLRVTGADGLLAEASIKLKSEGWASSVARLPSGEAVMIVDAKGKTLANVQATLARLQGGAFGALKAEVSALPTPNPR